VNLHWGTARNPRRPTHDSGGSSSGSAVAVAAGMVPLALGTDLGGSVRIPASLCGVAALKPSAGRVPLDGVLAVAPALDHVGALGAGVDDVRLGLEVLLGTPLPATLPARLRLGICDRWWRLADPETAALVAAALERLPVERVAVDLPHVESAFACGALICDAQAARTLAPLSTQPLSPTVRIALAVGRRIGARQLERAERVRVAIARELDDALGQCDLLATPTTAHPARAYARDALAGGALDEDAFRRRTAFTFPANLAGLPAAQVPCGLDGEGLPVGLQLIARRGADALALAAAGLAET
jgi:Asp-tRNA(Asn)/Glu-tRNA(Gln) amidotransferase A subunit family amidase